MRHALFLCLCFATTARSISNCVCLPSVILARVFHQKHGVTSTKEAYRVTVFPEYCKTCNRVGENVIELLPPPTRRGSTEENINCVENQQLYCTTHTRVLIKLFTPLLRAAKQSKWNNSNNKNITICISIDESNDYSLKARSTRRMRDLCF